MDEIAARIGELELLIRESNLDLNQCTTVMEWVNGLSNVAFTKALGIRNTDNQIG